MAKSKFIAILLTSFVVISVMSACGEDKAKKFEEPKNVTFDWTGALGPTWSTIDRSSFGAQNLKLVTDKDSPGGKYIEVFYPKGSASPNATKSSGAPVGGAQELLVNGQQPTLTHGVLTYWVRFDPEFDFVKGGKLPGLYGGDANAGGNQADGSDGFSFRLMWRQDGDGEIYAYLPDAQSQVDDAADSCPMLLNDAESTTPTRGTSMGRGKFNFKRGIWTKVQMDLTVNDIGSSNGRVILKIDDKQVLSCENLYLRNNKNLRIDGVFFSSFFGGKDDSWAPDSDQRIRFAQIQLA